MCGGAALVDEHLDGRVLTDERPRDAGVIQMDVRQQDLRHVADLDPFSRQ